MHLCMHVCVRMCICFLNATETVQIPDIFLFVAMWEGRREKKPSEVRGARRALVKTAPHGPVKAVSCTGRGKTGPEPYLRDG